MGLLKDAKIVVLPKIGDPRGNLTFIEASHHIPFEVKRVYYLYDVPAGETRGGHAHKELQQFLIAASGSFDVVLHDGQNSQRFHLNHPAHGLLIPTMVWRTLESFSSGSVCLVLASTHFDESDYYRDFDTFVAAVRRKNDG